VGCQHIVDAGAGGPHELRLDIRLIACTVGSRSGKLLGGPGHRVIDDQKAFHGGASGS
jgi:hypothetical protein